MHEVRIYDSAGKLKEVISPNALEIRGEEQIQSPGMFRKRQPTAKPPTKTPSIRKLGKTEKEN